MQPYVLSFINYWIRCMVWWSVWVVSINKWVSSIRVRVRSRGGYAHGGGHRFESGWPRSTRILRKTMFFFTVFQCPNTPMSWLFYSFSMSQHPYELAMMEHITSGWSHEPTAMSPIIASSNQAQRSHYKSNGSQNCVWCPLSNWLSSSFMY